MDRKTQSLIIPFNNSGIPNNQKDCLKFDLLDIGNNKLVLKDISSYQELTHGIGAFLYLTNIKTFKDYSEHLLKTFNYDMKKHNNEFRQFYIKQDNSTTPYAPQNEPDQSKKFLSNYKSDNLPHKRQNLEPTLGKNSGSDISLDQEASSQNPTHKILCATEYFIHGKADSITQDSQNNFFVLDEGGN